MKIRLAIHTMALLIASSAGAAGDLWTCHDRKGHAHDARSWSQESWQYLAVDWLEPWTGRISPYAYHLITTEIGVMAQIESDEVSNASITSNADGSVEFRWTKNETVYRSRCIASVPK